jgi:hypothetical protein
MLFENITKENVAHFAATKYKNSNFTRIDQFYTDLRKISIIKKQMNRFDQSQTKEEYQDFANKTVNSVVIFLNTFGEEEALRILFTLLETRFQKKLKPIIEVVFVETPLIVPGVLNQDVIIEHVDSDEFFRQFISDKYRGMFT